MRYPRWPVIDVAKAGSTLQPILSSRSNALPPRYVWVVQLPYYSHVDAMPHRPPDLKTLLKERTDWRPSSSRRRHSRVSKERQ